MKSIKTKFVTFAIIAILIPSLSLGLLSYFKNEELVKSHVTRELRVLASNVSRELDLWINENHHAVSVLSVSGLIINALTSLPRDSVDKSINYQGSRQLVLSKYLSSFQEKLPTIIELTIFDLNGNIVASSIQDSPNRFFASNEQHDMLTNNIKIKPPYRSDRYNTAVLELYSPILSYDEKIIGSILATLNMEKFMNGLVDNADFSLGEITLLGHSGNVLLSSNHKINYPTLLESEALEQLQAHSGNALTIKGLSHSKIIGLISMSKEVPVIVLVERDYAEVIATWIELRNLFISLVGLLIIIVGGIAFYIGHSIVASLSYLIEGTKRILNGDLNVQINEVKADEIGLLTSSFNKMTENLKHSQAEILAAHEAMQKQNQQLKILSITDSLTGLYNRNKLDAILFDQLARFERNHRPFSVLMMDIDHFKTLNDNYGHVIGDEILISVSQAIGKSIRTVDFAARYGGDEFVVILTETDAVTAVITAERIRAQVATNVDSQIKEATISITLSMGIIQCEIDDKTSKNVLSRVDEALYKAKNSGRNRIYCEHHPNMGVV